MLNVSSWTEMFDLYMLLTATKLGLLWLIVLAFQEKN